MLPYTSISFTPSYDPIGDPILESKLTEATNDAVNTSTNYTQNFVEGLDMKESCVCASIQDLSLETYATSGYTFSNNQITQTNAADGVFGLLDGHQPVVGDRLLLKNQTSSAQDGIYSVLSVGDGVSVPWQLERSSDANTAADLSGGSTTFVLSGSQANTRWTVAGEDIVNLNTDPVNWIQSGGSGTISALAPISIINDVVQSDGTIVTTNNPSTMNSSLTFAYNATDDKSAVLAVNDTNGDPILAFGPLQGGISNFKDFFQEINMAGASSSADITAPNINTNITNTNNHIANVSNPHQTTLQQVSDQSGTVTDSLITLTNTVASQNVLTVNNELAVETLSVTNAGALNLAGPVVINNSLQIDNLGADSSLQTPKNYIMNVTGAGSKNIQLQHGGISYAEVGNTGLLCDNINELTTNNGVLIDGVLIKDGLVDNVDVGGLTAFVNNLISGLNGKSSVRVATIAQLPATTYDPDYFDAVSGETRGQQVAVANGAIVIDGIALDVGDRILVKDGGSTYSLKENGLYEVFIKGSGGAPFQLLRTLDANNDPVVEVQAGMTVYVSEGTHAGKVFYQQTISPSITASNMNANDPLVFDIVKLPINDAGPPNANELYSSLKTQTELNLKENSANKGQPNGYASLDGAGKVPASQLELDHVIYKGVWDASTNTPTLTSGVGSAGFYYVVSVAGTTNIDGVTDWGVGDWIIFNGTVWEKSDHSDSVTSVAGKQGVVVLDAADIVSGTFADVRISQSSVTQHEAAINHLNLLNSGLHTHAEIDSHIADVTLHRLIDDVTPSTTTLYSGTKIESLIATAGTLQNIASVMTTSPNPGVVGDSLLSFQPTSDATAIEIQNALSDITMTMSHSGDLTCETVQTPDITLWKTATDGVMRIRNSAGTDQIILSGSTGQIDAINAILTGTLDSSLVNIKSAGNTYISLSGATSNVTLKNGALTDSIILDGLLGDISAATVSTTTVDCSTLSSGGYLDINPVVDLTYKGGAFITSGKVEFAVLPVDDVTPSFTSLYSSQKIENLVSAGGATLSTVLTAGNTAQDLSIILTSTGPGEPLQIKNSGGTTTAKIDYNGHITCVRANIAELDNGVSDISLYSSIVPISNNSLTLGNPTLGLGAVYSSVIYAGNDTTPGQLNMRYGNTFDFMVLSSAQGKMTMNNLTGVKVFDVNFDGDQTLKRTLTVGETGQDGTITVKNTSNVTTISLQASSGTMTSTNVTANSNLTVGNGIDGTMYLKNSAGTNKITLSSATGGKIAFDADVTASTTTPNKINLLGDTYGFSILAATLGYVAPTNAVHKFYVNGAPVMSMSATSLKLDANTVDNSNNQPSNLVLFDNVTHATGFNSNVSGNLVCISKNANVDICSQNNVTAFFSGTACYNFANSTAWNTISDSRLKNNIVTYDESNACSILEALRVVNFTFNTDFCLKYPQHSGITQLGFIADEFEAVLPSRVKMHQIDLYPDGDSRNYEADGVTKKLYRTIDTTDLVPLLVSAHQCQAVKITNLQNTITTQQTLITDLTDIVVDLQARVAALENA